MAVVSLHMSTDQIIIFCILISCLVLFVWGKYRYDLVAVFATISVVLFGLIPAEDAFIGFSHPAVITVATVLIISDVIKNSGVVDLFADKLKHITANKSMHVAGLTGFAALISGFMNNVGALALLMPVAIKSANKINRSPSLVLMPLAFGSIIGGLTTLIGTPPNIIISAYRETATGKPFAMFDFFHVGGLLALGGAAFISSIGWRFIPIREKAGKGSESYFKIENYFTELVVTETSEIRDQPLREIQHLSNEQIVTAALIRDGAKRLAPPPGEKLRVNDVLLVRGMFKELKNIMHKTGLVHRENIKIQENEIKSKNVILVEAVISPEFMLIGQTNKELTERTGAEINLLAIGRSDAPIKKSISNVVFKLGDVLLLQGEADLIFEMIRHLGCYPLKERGLQLKGSAKTYLPILIFGISLIAVAMGLVTAPIAFTCAIGLFVLTRQLSVFKLYDSINWSVIVLLGAMIPVGLALEKTGATLLIANSITGLSAWLSPWMLLLLVLILTMTLSDIINNAATAVIMAPIAYSIAKNLSVNPDTFLMAVAIGASCAFLTPIGHHSNTLVMGPGHYKFADYWRMGLPLEIIICAITIPALLWFWPL